MLAWSILGLVGRVITGNEEQQPDQRQADQILSPSFRFVLRVRCNDDLVLDI